MNFDPYWGFAFELESLPFLFLIGSLFVFIFGWYPSPKYKIMLTSWCEKNNYKIKKIQKIFLPGPFSWLFSNGFSYFYFEVIDDEGNLKKGYARCGNFIFGSHISEVKVIWKD